MNTTTTLSALPSTENSLPVHFFTIVLNGEPFLRYHIDKFIALPFRWHWHLVEGVASLTHDTSWSIVNGGRIPEDMHRDGLSSDGTTEYLDELARQHPEHITIYRKQRGEFWDGKLEMVAAPIDSLNEECLLWQIDADELWTTKQICLMHRLFVSSPQKTAAFFYCKFFVSENLLLTTHGTYGNNPIEEWLRCWRFVPGSRWFSHEPPRLCYPQSSGSWQNIATINPFTHAETEAYGIYFQHFAYVTDAQLRFKEVYYGYRGAMQRWNALKSVPAYPVLLREFFPWVDDETLVNTASSVHVKPLARKNSDGLWMFAADGEESHLPSLTSFQLNRRKTRFRLINFFICTRIRGKRLMNRLLQITSKHLRGAE